MTKTDGIHENFFSMPELPYKRKEREAILLMKQLLKIWNDISLSNEEVIDKICTSIRENRNIVDWILKYKGE